MRSGGVDEGVDGEALCADIRGQRSLEVADAPDDPTLMRVRDVKPANMSALAAWPCFFM